MWPAGGRHPLYASRNWGHVWHCVVLHHTDDERKGITLFSLKQLIHRGDCDGGFFVVLVGKENPWVITFSLSRSFCSSADKPSPHSARTWCFQESLSNGPLIDKENARGSALSWRVKKKKTINENETMRKHGVQPTCRILVVTSEIFGT